MASGSRQTEKEDANFNMRTSFSWDQAFFSNEGFLDAKELSSMMEGGGDEVNYELQKLEEIESLETKLFEEIDASKQKSRGKSNLNNSSIKVASGKKDSHPKKVTGLVGPCKAAPIKTQSTSGGSPGNNVKSSATVSRRSIGSKSVKATDDLHSKTPPGTKTKNKMATIITRLPRTSPSSPISPGSSGSNQQTKRGGSSVKPSATNTRRKDDILNVASSICSLKNKPPPLNSHPTSPLGLSNKTSSSTTKRPSDARCGRDTGVHDRSTSKIHSTNQIPDQQGKQPAGFGSKAGSSTRSPVQSTVRGMPASKGKSCVLPGISKTDDTQDTKAGSPNGTKAGKPLLIKTVPNSQKTITPKTSQRHSSVKAKRSVSASRGTKDILLISPEILDIKGKINALKMEIDMQKKDRTSSLGIRQMNRT